jgi:uncharacterized membrane protein
MAVALLSISPIQIIYAQEARPYSLLTLAILISGASLLWAIRTNRRIAWCIYIISLTLGFYTQYFFILVVLGYISYVLSTDSFRFTNKIRCFFLATFISCIAFSPWVIVALNNFTNFKEASTWINKHTLTFPGAIRLWSENISFAFIEPRASEYFGLGKYGFYFLIPFVLFLIGYSIYYLFLKGTSNKAYLFIFYLIISTALPLIAADFILGGNRQIWPRYLMPCFLGVQLSVAHLLASKALSTQSIRQRKKQNFWLIVSTIVIVAGITFSSIIIEANTWWSKQGGQQINSFSHIINQANNPTILINHKPEKYFTESIFFYNLKPSVKIFLIEENKLNTFNFKNEGDIFILKNDKNLQLKLKQLGYSVELVSEFDFGGPRNVAPIQLFKLKNL